MNREKAKEFFKITGYVTAALDSLLKAQDQLIDLICEDCQIPEYIKLQMKESMYEILEIKNL